MPKNGRLPTPFRDKKGLYFARRRVPKDLRPYFEGEFVHKSLATRDPVEAARRFPAINGAIDEDFERRRRSMEGWLIGLSDQPARFDQLVDEWFEALDELERLLLSSSLTRRLPFDSTIEKDLAKWGAADRSRLIKLMVAGAAERSGLGPIPSSVEKSFSAYVDDHLAQIVGRFLPAPSHSTVDARLHTPEVRELDLTITLSGLKKEWAKKQKPSKSSFNELAKTIAEFISVYGNIPAAEVTKDDIRDFQSRLLKQPRSMPHKGRSRSLEERVKLPGPRVSETTVGKKLTLFKALLSFGFGEGFIPHNAGSRIKTGPKHKSGKRAQFLPDEVTAIFNLPLFQPSGWRLHRSVSDVTLAWLMLVGLTNGPRLKEAGQAELADVVTTGSVIAIRVTADTEEDEEADEGATPADRKSVKTEESERFLVIHPVLVELGFGRFIDALRRAGATRLFPDLWQSGSPSTHDASRSLNLEIDRVTTRRRVCYHSLRHTWIAAAENTDMKERTLRQLSGHAPRDESEKYGEAYLPVLALNAAKIQFDMVDWQPMMVAWSTIDWDDVVKNLLRRYPDISAQRSENFVRA